MPRHRLLIFFILAILFIHACRNTEKKEQKPLVYEGMSISELEGNLGTPISIDSSGEVYSTKLKKKISVQKWTYDKRVVLIINDTVKDANIN